MKYLFTLVLCLLFSKLLFSQNTPWFITRGLATDEVAWAVDVDEFGQIFWATEQKDVWPNWYYNIICYKIDETGEQISQSESWGEEFNEIAFKASVNQGKLFLSGRKDSAALPTSGDAFVKVLSTNNFSSQWMFHYNPLPDYGYEEYDGLLVDANNIFVSGWKQQESSNDMDFLIQKLDSSGNLIYSKTWDFGGLRKFDGANGHMAADANFLYLAGHINRTNLNSLDGDGALVCFSKNDGEYQWHVAFGGALYDDALGMGMSSDSMLYISGYTGSMGNGSQVYLKKFNRSGTLLWDKYWGGNSTEDSRIAVCDGDSIIYQVGHTGSYGHGGKDIFVLKYNSEGTLLDSIIWGGAWDETAKDACIKNGIIYITGETKSFGNGLINGDHKTDALLLKINGRAMLAPDTILSEQNSMVTNQFKIYPNPARNSIHISQDGSMTGGRVKLTDCTGKILMIKPLEYSEQKLDFDQLPNGVYFISLYDKLMKPIQTSKLIILK